MARRLPLSSIFYLLSSILYSPLPSFPAIPDPPPPVVPPQLPFHLIRHRRQIAHAAVHLRLPHVANPGDHRRNRPRLQRELQRRRRQVRLRIADRLLHLPHPLHRPLQPIPREVTVPEILRLPLR